MESKKKSIMLSLLMCLFVSITSVLLSGCGFLGGDSDKIKEIYIKEGSVQTEVAHNSDFSTEFIEVIARLSSGKERNITPSECEISTIDTSTVGEKELVVSYEAYEVRVTINVYATLSSLSVTDINDKVLHNSNNGKLDLQNAKLVLKYSDDSTATVNIMTNGSLTEGIVLENDATNVVGNHTLKIKYQNKECTFDYEVQKYLTKIEAKVEDKYKSVAFKGSFDSSKVTAIGTYSDGTTKDFANDELIISSLDTNSKDNIKDDNVVRVALKADENIFDEINVRVYAKLTSISYVSGIVDRVKYNTDLDTSNVKIIAYYNNDTQVQVTENIVITGYNKTPNELGSQTLTIKYKDATVTDYVTTTKLVEVYEELESIKVEAVDASDATTGYVLQGTDWETEKANVCAKFKIVAVYTKNEVVLNRTEEYNNVSFSNIDTTTLGEKGLTVSYNGKTKEIKINVIENWTDVPSLEVESIEIVNSSVASEVDYNGTFDTSNLQIEVTYANELTQVLNASEYTTGENEIKITKGIDTAVHGEQTLEVSYKGKSATKVVTVKAYLMSISINEDSLIDTLTYGEELDLSDVEILALYTDNNTAIVNAENNASKFSNTTLGEQAITFSYSMQKVDGSTVTKTTSMNIRVIDKISKLVDVVVPVTESEYGVEYDYSNITASVEYLSGATEDVSGSLTFAGLDINKVGKQTLEISYTKDGTTVTKTVEVTIYDVLASVSIKDNSVASSVKMGDTLDTSSLILVLTYKSTSNEEITSGFETGTFDSTKEGEFDLTVTYGEFSAKKSISVLRTYKIMGYSNPTFVDVYNKNSVNKNTFTSTGSNGNIGFTDLSNEYVVGNENEFVFAPIIKDSNTNEITEFKANIKVYLWNGESSEYELLSNDLSSYVTIDDTLHTFKFTTLAENNKFKIEMLPYRVYADEVEKVSVSQLEFNVVNAYNVYNAKDLSMFDNVNSLSKWSEKKTTEELELSKNIHGLVLHSDISITKDDIPSVHFFTKDEINSSDSDYDKVVGSLKDRYSDDLGLIYHRTINEGATFTIEGNYFKLSAQELPLIVRQEVDDTWPVVTEGDAITVHTALFGFTSVGYTNANYNLNNIALFGNGKKSENADTSGCVMFMKTKAGVSFSAYNNVSQGWYISYLFEGNNKASDSSIIKLEKVNAFDAYQTLLYPWGCRDVRIIDSIMIGAGGPVMICDHVGNNETTGEGGYITNVKVTNSILESYVAGTEGWFAIYEGSGALVSSIKAMNQLVTPYGNTLCDTTGEKINLIAVYKSSSVEGLTNSVIRGTFTDTDEKYTNGLDVGSTAIASVKTNIYTTLAQNGMSEDAISSTLSQMAVLQTFNGTVGVPGADGWMLAPDTSAFSSSEGYMNVYLFNGMGAVFGLNKKVA